MASLAILIAASFASAPVLSSMVLPSEPGRVAASLPASSRTGALSMPLNRWSSEPTAVETADTMSGWACPRIELICPEVKSRIGVPSVS